MDDRYAIHAAKTEIREGYDTGDVERIASIYAEGFGYLAHGLPSFSGAESKAVLRELLTALFAANEVSLVPIIIEVFLFGTSALEYGWHELTLRPRTGGPLTVLRTRYVELWRKEGGDAWRIALFLDNVDHEPVLVESMILAIRAGEFGPSSRGPG